MGRGAWVTAGVLVLVLALILGVLLWQATTGPAFRPGDHESYEECIGNIPREWPPGSLERSGAEDACYYVHRRSPGR